MLLPVPSMRPNSYTMSKVKKICMYKCLTLKALGTITILTQSMNDVMDISVLWFCYCWSFWASVFSGHALHCGQVKFWEDAMCAWSTGYSPVVKDFERPFLRGTPGQSPLVNGIMYCTRYCLRTAVRAAANIQRYVKAVRRALVSPR